MIRLIRGLFALPFRVLGGVLSAFGAPAGAALLKAAWWLGGDDGTGVLAAAEIKRHHGAEAAALKARQWLARRPSAALAAFAGLLHLELDQVDQAAQCLRLGKQRRTDRDGHLELLELLLTCGMRDRAATEAMTRAWEDRRDLNLSTRRLILEQRMWQETLARRFEAAADYAERLLDVSPDPQASLVMWAVCTHRGQPARARQHLGAAAMPGPQSGYFLYLAASAIGDQDRAEAALADLRQSEPTLAEQAQQDVEHARAAT